MTPAAPALALAALLGGCSLAPHYTRPAVAGQAAPAWKTVAGWRPADPADDRPRGDWWAAFGDPTLDALVARVDARNQTLAQALATYRLAAATTREARASLFPTLGANGSVTHSFSGSGRVITGDIISSTTGTGTGANTGTGTGTGGTTGTTTGTGTTGTATGGTSTGTTTGLVSNGSNTNSYRLTLQATWQPDFFGQITNTVRNARFTQAARLAADPPSPARRGLTPESAS